MKHKLFALVLSLLLTVALTACTAGKTDTQNGNGTVDNTMTQSSTARNRNVRSSTSDHSGSSAARGRYFADKRGDVRDDRTDWLGDDVRRATDDMMDSARNMGRKMGDTIEDMTN